MILFNILLNLLSLCLIIVLIAVLIFKKEEGFVNTCTLNDGSESTHVINNPKLALVF